MRVAPALVAIIIPLALGGCTIIEEEDRFDPGDGPGQTPWNHDENVLCPNGNECGEGEVCENGVCQMARCAEPYESQPPMGINHYFGTDGEMAIISDDSYVDAFEGNGGAYINSWDLSGESVKIVDVAGGNLTGSRPQSVAAAIEFSDTVRLFNAGGTQSINVGIWPKALAAGDVDADGTDELVALSSGGEIRVCGVEVGQCAGWNFSASVEGKDVAVDDVDGDGFEEAIFLIDHGGESQIIVLNTDHEKTGQEETTGWQFNFPVRSFAAGDLDGDKVAEIVTLEDGGWWAGPTTRSTSSRGPPSSSWPTTTSTATPGTWPWATATRTTPTRSSSSGRTTSSSCSP